MRTERPAVQAAQRYLASDLATVAPFVRNSLNIRHAMTCVLVSLVPCVGMALYNTGYQVNLAFAQGIQPSGWRPRLLEALGLGHSPGSALDCTVLGALFFVPTLAVAVVATGLSERWFARARGRRVDHVALPVIALLFSLSLPAGVPLWQVGIGCAIGVVIGKEIFGGLGRNFVSPVVVALAFLFFAYPGTLSGDSVWVPVPGHVAPTPLAIANQLGPDGLDAAGVTWLSAALGGVPGAMGETSALACLLGFGLLLYTGVASWRIVAGGCLGLVVGVWGLQSLHVASPIGTLPWHWHLVSGSFAFGLVFLATDPVTSASTNPGRWLHGALIGLVVAVVRLANPAYQEGVLLALLLGSVSAPLLDRCVAFAQMRWNRAAHGR